MNSFLQLYFELFSGGLTKPCCFSRCALDRIRQPVFVCLILQPHKCLFILYFSVCAFIWLVTLISCFPKYHQLAVMSQMQTLTDV